jgi:hypothetical protein
MSITKPFTFVAGTKARANEVNQNFDVLYSQVNSNISAINTNANDIDTLDSNKANVNGSSSQRFACADPTSPSDAVNKQSLNKAIGNSINYIDGYVISKDSGSPNNTILVTAGSCYDSTKTIVLNKANSSTKTNDNQAANATYYVYVIGNSTGSQIDILISESGVTPGLPSGYTLYRQIGYYTTDSNNNIKTITQLSNSVIFNISEIAPDYDNREVLIVDTLYTATELGWVFFYQCSNNGGICYYEINGLEFVISNNQNGDTDSAGAGVWFMVSPGDTYKLKSAGSFWNAARQLFFCPLKGGN